jgi:hypothetical protein
MVLERGNKVEAKVKEEVLNSLFSCSLLRRDKPCSIVLKRLRARVRSGSEKYF